MSKYLSVPDAGKVFGKSKYAMYRLLDKLREEGKFNEVCIQPGPRSIMIDVEKFEAWLKSRHLKWAR